MIKWAICAVLLLLAALSIAEPSAPQMRAVGTNGKNPYLFLSMPRGRANSKDFVRSGLILNTAGEDYEDNNDDVDSPFDDEELEDDNDNEERNIASFDSEDEDQKKLHEDEDDDLISDSNDDEDDINIVHVHPHTHMYLRSSPQQSADNSNLQLVLKNAKSTHMMVSREHAGAIMVPDGVIEIEGQSIVDEKTGKAALLVPRAALDAIPDGSVVALMERSLDSSEQERANRVYVRRRRKGSRVNVRRRGGKRRRRGGQRRRGGGKRKNVRVYTIGGNRRRGPARRRLRRPTVIQG